MNPDYFDEHLHRVRSGAAAFDEALGGGWPCGRIVELFGKEGSGKRSVALAALALTEWAYAGVWVELRDGPSFDPSYATACGWRDQDVTYLNTERGRARALEYVEKVVRKGSRQLVVLNGAETIPRGDELAMRLISQQVRRLTAAAHATGTCVMVLREEQRDSAPFAPDPGALGNALRFYGSVRVHLAAERWTEAGKAGALGHAHVVKNKCGPVFARFVFAVQHSRGLVVDGVRAVPSP